MENLIYTNLENASFIMLLAAIALSLYVLSKGADLFVNQAVGISVKFNIPKVIIGATIVSLGTTLPEVTVSSVAALKGNADLAIGNAIGSIIANTALIIGVAALIGDMKIDKKSVMFQFITLFISMIVFSIMAINKVIKPGMGIVLLVILAIYSIISTKRGKDQASEVDDMEVNNDPFIKQALLFVLGIALVVLSSKVLIPTIEITALRVGIPQSVIAATLVAFGTSLPELVTAITAARKGHPELAVGNVLGADILNILFVIGLSSIFSKTGLIVPDQFFRLDMPVMFLSVGFFFIAAINKGEKVSKLESFILIGLYFGYLIINYI